ncbi:hypothetical protein Tco_0637868 [Tanacetum coccineum]
MPDHPMTLKSYALSWKPCQGDSLNLPDHSESRTEESSKRAGDELKSDKSKKQKIDEHVEAEKDDDPEEEEMKKHMEIVQDEEEIAIDAIPLATKPPMIV